MYKNYAGDKNLLPLADIFLLKVCAFGTSYMYTFCTYMYIHVHMKFNRPTALVHVHLMEQDRKLSPPMHPFRILVGSYITLLCFNIISCDSLNRRH